MSTDIAAAVDDFWAARQTGVYFPEQWLDRLSMDEGYQVQLALRQRRLAEGERHIGWKVGLTSRAMQEQFQVHEPLFGYLLESSVMPSGVALSTDEIIRPGFENELCLRLGSDLTGPGVDLDSARKAVAAVYPAIELIETRGDFTRYLSVALADNIQQYGIVLGPALEPLPHDLDLAAVEVSVTIDDQVVAEARGDAVLGHPLNALVWLANKLTEHGQSLKAGDLVMTGSFTRQFALERGNRVRTAFTGVGVVELSLT